MSGVLRAVAGGSGASITPGVTPVVGGTDKGVFYQDGQVMTNGSNLLFDKTAILLTVGSGSGGLIIGKYTGGSQGAIYPGGVTPGAGNYILFASAATTELNAATTLQFNIGGSGTPKMSIVSTAGAGPSITAGTATTDVAGESVTQTYSNAAVTFSGMLQYTLTNTASNAASLMYNFKVGAASFDKMTVAGAMTWGAYGAGALTTDGSGNITAVSDISVKDNVKTFSRGIDAVMALKPITHGYTKESGLDHVIKRDYVGFSANEVEDVIPEAVSRDRRGLRTLADRGILAAVVNAIQNQERRLRTIECH